MKAISFLFFAVAGVLADKTMFAPQTREEVAMSDAYTQLAEQNSSFSLCGGCCGECGCAGCGRMDLHKVNEMTDALVLLKDEKDANGNDPAFSTEHKFSHHERRQHTQDEGDWRVTYWATIPIFNVWDSKPELRQKQPEEGKYFLARPKNIRGSANQFNIDFERMDESTIEQYREELSDLRCKLCASFGTFFGLFLGGVAGTVAVCTECEGKEIGVVPGVFAFSMYLVSMFDACSWCQTSRANEVLNNVNLEAADPSNAASRIEKPTAATETLIEQAEKEEEGISVPEPKMCSNLWVIVIASVCGLFLFGFLFAIFCTMGGRGRDAPGVGADVVDVSEFVDQDENCGNWGGVAPSVHHQHEFGASEQPQDQGAMMGNWFPQPGTVQYVNPAVHNSDNMYKVQTAGR